MSAYELEKKLIGIFKENPHRYLGEETLMKEFGLAGAIDESTESGNDIARAIEVLRLQEYEIDGDETQGWRLVSLPGTINYLEVESSLKTTFLGQCLFCYRIIGSTNQTARMLADTGAPDGTLLVAEEQSRGRGRFENSWYSPAGGGIWASLILRPRIKSGQLGSLAMLAALSICLAVEEQTGLKPQIKWPNDICLERKKVAGILCEAGLRSEELRYIILGFGVNVNIDSFPPELSSTAISLALATGKDWIYRPALLGGIMDKLEEGYFRFLTDGFASFLPRVQIRDCLRGCPLKVRLPGGELIYGVSRGIDENGALLLETSPEKSLKAVAAGHIVHW